MRKRSLRCPGRVFPPCCQLAYRFVFSTVRHDYNFLPNVLFDRLRGSSVDYDNMDDHQYCARCGISLFDTLAGARRAYEDLSPYTKTKLGYSHLAQGILNEPDGWMKPVGKNGHFSFFESMDADLTNNFIIIEQL